MSSPTSSPFFDASLRYDLARSALLMLVACRSGAVAAARDAAVLDDALVASRESELCEARQLLRDLPYALPAQIESVIAWYAPLVKRLMAEV
jgi:inorganic pyrophosphatase